MMLCERELLGPIVLRELQTLVETQGPEYLQKLQTLERFKVINRRFLANHEPHGNQRVACAKGPE